MNKLITNQGEEVCDEKEISIEVGKFYKKLYEKKKIVEDCEIIIIYLGCLFASTSRRLLTQLIETLW